MKILLATKNKNKIIEISNKFMNIKDVILSDLRKYKNVPDVPETGSTFDENALIKARAISEFTGETALADDSGLVVDALDGRPGILSARYGGEGLNDRDRYMLLLDEMKDVPADSRTARFVCSIVIYLPAGEYFTAKGTCEGIIATEPRGSQGFGYDPVFYLPRYSKTMAEIPLTEKNKISHRAQALTEAALILEQLQREK